MTVTTHKEVHTTPFKAFRRAATKLPRAKPLVIPYAAAVGAGLVTALEVFPGTGGALVAENLLRVRAGYIAAIVERAPKRESPYAQLMQKVKDAFGRNTAHIAYVFGVSRQTLYNWLNGEEPKPAHRVRIRELAEAARIFESVQLEPTHELLRRRLRGSKSFLDLLRDGASGEDTAKLLLRVSARADSERKRLDRLPLPKLPVQHEPLRPLAADDE